MIKKLYYFGTSKIFGQYPSVPLLFAQGGRLEEKNRPKNIGK